MCSVSPEFPVTVGLRQGSAIGLSGMYSNAVEIVAKTEELLPSRVVERREALEMMANKVNPKENINNAMHTRSQNRNRYIRQEES